MSYDPLYGTWNITDPRYSWKWEPRLMTAREREEHMTVLETINKERRETAERKRIEKFYDALDALDLDALAEGSVLRFDVEDGTDVKTYAVLHAGGRWWATGGTAPNGVGLEDLLAWMIRKRVNPNEIEVVK